MFTGIIEEQGVVKSIKKTGHSIMLEISAHTVLEGLKVGDSISTDGVCLTVTSFNSTMFCADVMPETMLRSNLGSLCPGARVNLERALTLNSRLGGHLVSGHIDGTGEIIAMKRDENSIEVTISAPAKILRYIVEKGSVAIDGASLTIAAVDSNSFKVSIIPHTQGATTLTKKRIGESVNLENDMIVKYVEKLITPTLSEDNGSGKITLDFLTKHGF